MFTTVNGGGGGNLKFGGFNDFFSSMICVQYLNI